MIVEADNIYKLGDSIRGVTTMQPLRILDACIHTHAESHHAKNNNTKIYKPKPSDLRLVASCRRTPQCLADRGQIQ